MNLKTEIKIPDANINIALAF